MTRHRPRKQKSKVYTFDLTCEDKRFFETEEEALEAADVGMLENMSLMLGVYQCPTCHNWHLTSVKA